MYEQASDKWIPIVHNFNKKTKTPTVTSLKTEKPIMSSNRFTPLTNLNENLTGRVRLACNSTWSTATKSTNQPSAGNKIPTIINRRVMNGHIKKPTRTSANSSCVTNNKINTFDDKVKKLVIVTLKKVCSFTKPGAHIDQLVHSQEMEFKCPGRKDVIVINGGTNDIDNISTKRNGVSVMTQFVQKYNNSNIIVENKQIICGLKSQLYSIQINSSIVC
jgi:hypothetical protein